MKRTNQLLALTLVGAALSLGLTGCVVAPPQQVVYTPQPSYAYTQPVAPPPQTVYVQPAYAAPSIGFVWAYHPHFGWGYHHPHRGWARGWR